MSDWLDALELVKTRYRRGVRGIEINLETATVAFTLGCGHTVKEVLASHPIKSVEALSVDIGDEMDCDQCSPNPDVESAAMSDEQPYPLTHLVLNVNGEDRHYVSGGEPVDDSVKSCGPFTVTLRDADAELHELASRKWQLRWGGRLPRRTKKAVRKTVTGGTRSRSEIRRLHRAMLRAEVVAV